MGNEPRYLFFFRSTASARCFPTWRAAFPRLEPAQGLTIVMSSRSALCLSRGWLSKRMYVCMVIRYSRVWINRVRLPILLVVS